ncbi:MULTISPECIES: hypothetical protein [Nocardiaceae]|uniref:Uncharacterized protein n=1 Tax=Rhodococcoides corynebacterioides TaxID=53972 RepID=A0ABS2KUG3_9NOCA|nr:MULTISPECIES: hypothetical protein [Rhodococcus]MBM7415583.1 hypothetical protein [Rhodococcus corynebacterioides]MBP1118045.1 hypothetical protein [Rhodococcus sp. PvP016]
MNDTPRNSSAPETRGDTTVVSAVLLYHLDGSTVTASLLSPIDGSDLGVAESIDLEDFSPEQIGLTVPMLWDLVDVADACVMSVVTSGAAADIDVAPPILELAFGVPVFDSPTPVVADTPAADAALDDDATPPADDVAPWQRTTPSAVAAAAAAARPPLRPTRPVPATPVRRSATGAGKSGVVKSGASASPISKSAVARAGVAGAAAAAARPRIASADKVTPVDKAVPSPTSSDTDTEVFPAVVAPAVVAPAAVDPIDDARTEAIPVVTAASVTPTGRRSRRFVGFAGAAAAAALVAAGIGTAAVMSGGPDSVPQNTAAEQQAPNGGSASPLGEAPAAAAPVVPAAPAASPAPAVPAAPVPTEDAAADAAASDWTAPSAAPWSPTAAAPAPTSWTTTPSQQSFSPTAVPAPQFTVPVPEQDPNKSPQQLQDEAWQKHWQQTGQWLNQEFPQ